MQSRKIPAGECTVTVIIPVYKVEKYIRKAIDSVLSQNNVDIFIILVDDGSPDGCPGICDEYAGKYDNIAVIHKENGGLSSARNAGLDYIDYKTKYVLFLDSDDQLEKDALAGMVQKAEDTGAEMVIPDRYRKVYNEDDEGRICLHFPERLYTSNPKEFALNVMIGNGRAWRASSVLYSYETMMRSGAKFPLGRIAEDISFNFIVLAKCNKISIYPYSTLRNLKRENSITTTFQKNFEEDIKYIDKQARKFLTDIDQNTLKNNMRCDDLLCRNVMLYLFDVMGKKNKCSYTNKKEKAKQVIHYGSFEKVIREKRMIPYFESRKTRIALSVIYILFRLRLDSLALRLISVS